MVDFAVHGGPLRELGVRVLAASVDSVANVTELRAALRVGYRMFGEVDAHEVAASTGGHIHVGDDGDTYTHATGFLLDPDGVVVNAVYSTGPIGRFWASEILRKVRFELDRVG